MTPQPSPAFRPTKPLPIAKTMPLDVGILHFVGIGGIGMSGIAELLHNLGYTVQGSDLSESGNVTRLQGLGIKTFIGQAAANIEDAAVVVVSSAIKKDNPELQAAREKRLPVVRRAEMLAELMRLKMAVAVGGTHGKTTTTALTSCLMEAAGLQPTIINGGIINAHNTNAILGAGEWMVVEADESDGTFTRLPATIAIVTNIDPEHLDHYGTFDKVREAFQTFLTNLPFYGFGVLCIDHPEVQALVSRVQDRRILTYGFSPQADIRATNVKVTKEGQYFDVVLATHEIELTNLFLAMHGKYNISNALAAIAVAVELGAEAETLRAALAAFSGVKRRFTKTGEVEGITIIDDYGHHPVEIAATLNAAREAQEACGGKVIAVVQPHRYSRVHALFDEFCTCFNDADTVIVTEIYTAGEAPIAGADADALVSGLKKSGHRDVSRLESREKLAATVKEIAENGDMVVCLGAGSISSWAQALPEELKRLV